MRRPLHNAKAVSVMKSCCVDMQPVLFRCVKRPDGSFDIQKNGEHLLTCTGSEQEAQNIVRMLNNDGRERITK